MESAIIGMPKLVEQDTGILVSVSLIIGQRSHELWYGTPPGSVSTAVDPFVPAALLATMATGGCLRTIGPISAKLLRSIPMIQDIFAVWDPRFRRIALEAEPKSGSGRGMPQGVAAFFTGGVDSWYTLLKHFDEITHLIFVHGFDVRLDDLPLRKKVSATIQGVAAGLQKPLVEVETNLRTITDQYVEWDYYHGGGLASVALLLSPRFRKVYIPGTHSYAALLPLGSHPMLDPLWSTEETEIVHDGCEAPRVHKVARIASSDLALRTLRVCWENRGGAYNCGQCEKCLRTMVALRVVGALERCTTFDRPLDLRAVARLHYRTTGGRDHIGQNLEALREWSIDDPSLARALQDCLNDKYHQGVWGFIEGARSRFNGFWRRLQAGGNRLTRLRRKLLGLRGSSCSSRF